MASHPLVGACILALLLAGSIAPIQTTPTTPTAALGPALRLEEVFDGVREARDPPIFLTAPPGAGNPSRPAQELRPVPGGAQTAQLALLDALKDPRTQVADLQAAVASFYRDAGFDVAATEDYGGFEANSSITFTYSLGDIDADGVGDLAFSMHCVDADICPERSGQATPPPAASPAGGRDCNTSPRTGIPIPGRLHGVSGANGSIIWSIDTSRLDWNLTARDLDPLRALYHDARLDHLKGTFSLLCPLDFIVGTLPTPAGGHDLLLYRFALFTSCAGPSTPTQLPYPVAPAGILSSLLLHPSCHLVVLHELRHLDRATGTTAAAHYEVGLVTANHDPLAYGIPPFQFAAPTARAFAIHADSLLVNPILQVPPSAGVRVVPAATEAALFLQGVSFDLVAAAPTLMVPGMVQDHDVLESYTPREWAARLDLATMAAVWRNNATFGPEPGRSVLPKALMSPAIPWDRPFAAHTHWDHVPCCFDQTGDAVPDLTFLTLEWSAAPILNPEGPHDLDSRLVVFDGATGSQAWQTVVAHNAQRFTREETRDGPACTIGPYPFLAPARYMTSCVLYAFQPYVELLGDANGDGASDLLVHLVHHGEEPRHELTVRNGRDGSELWRMERPRTLYTLPIGDADADGGNDVLAFEWQRWEAPHMASYHYTNMTAVSISAHSGRDGARLWSHAVRTFTSPADLRMQVAAFRAEGLPDLNGDGVGEVPADDPLYLPDLEQVHRVSYLDGRTGRPHMRFDAVGSFLFISHLGDVTGDGTDDVAVLNGDVIDLWTTVYDGASGQALWSRRVISPRVDEYVSAVPSVRYHALEVDGRPDRRPVLNFQFHVTTGGGFMFIQSYYPQILSLESDGTLHWALPGIGHELADGWIDGATTGVRSYHRLVGAHDAPQGADAALDSAGRAAPLGALYALGLAAGLPLAIGARRWRGRR